MASSSSSSQSIPAWSYDVFLSFRGEDTRKGFVGHLYAALEHKGIYTYKDDETLARGESIGPTLLKAIEESRIAVVVFSKNYADSSWCLAELAHIIECVDKRGQILMPIFYYVDPSDVRKLKRKYEEAFSKHERENKENVETWRKALEKAGSISGWTINDTINCYEAKCIKEIVGTISNKLPTVSANVNKKLVGIEARLRDLKSKLRIGSDGVRIVGIWGVGGGGKTTLASAAYAELSHLFEAHCLLQNIREESNKHGLKKLQKEFLKLVLKTKDSEVGSELEGRSMIERKLRSKRVLVVLDDVDDRKQVEELAGSHAWFGEGSRIIITTRDKHLLSTRYADEVYEVSLLSHDEAMELFRRHAYRNNDKPIEDYEMLSEKVVSYARGLPLALEVLGSFLYDKDKGDWKCALARLKDIPDDEVTKRLKISYDGLTAHEKVLFLDIACCFRGRNKDEAMKVLDACDLHPGIGIKVLIQKSLIKVSKYGRFEMHDLIEEMAHYIVRGEHPNNPEKHSRILKEEDLAYLCDLGADALPMETEVLFRFAPLDLSHVVANMKKLRCIRLYQYPASSFPSNFQPKELGYLELPWSQQKELWHGYKSLPNLKILNLRYSNLITTPDFDGLPCLERLILQDCTSLEKIHPSIGYHKRLVFVDMSYCKRLNSFPPIIQMQMLETLDLSYCSKLQQFPDIKSNMSLPCLERLILSDCKSLEEIHSSIGYHKRLVFVNLTKCTALKRFPPIIHMKKLETLYLSYCHELQQFPDIRSNMDSLVTLDLHHTGIEIIPPSVGLFCTNLVSFDLHGCSKLKRIEGNFHLLRCLKHLDLSWCKLGDGDIPSDIFCELLNLQRLNLSGNNFSRLPSGISRLPCLKLLNLSHCINLVVEFSDLPSSIAILNAQGCDSLEIVRDLSDYKWLWKVSLPERTTNKRVLLSMLQEHAVKEYRFMSVFSHNVQPSSSNTKLVKLQLPHNWYSDFSGFLLSLRAHDCNDRMYRIVIKQEMSTDHPKEFGEDCKKYDYEMVGYVPFSSLRHILWFNPTYTQNISFQTENNDPNYDDEVDVGLSVELVPIKSKIGDLNEHPIDYSECWDEEFEDDKTFEITNDAKSSEIQISWGW